MPQLRYFINYFSTIQKGHERQRTKLTICTGQFLVSRNFDDKLFEGSEIGHSRVNITDPFPTHHCSFQIGKSHGCGDEMRGEKAPLNLRQPNATPLPPMIKLIERCSRTNIEPLYFNLAKHSYQFRHPFSEQIRKIY